MTQTKQPTKPSAKDKAVALYNRVFSPDASYFDWKDGESYKVYCIRVCQEAIEAHETGVAELLEALRAIIHPDNERHIEFDSRREYYVAQIEGGEYHRAMQAIAKCERSE